MLDDRLDALERRVAALEAGDAVPPAARGPEAGTFWALETLREQVAGEDGAVLWTGVVPTPGGVVEWQMARAATELLDPEDPTPFADSLAALGHPVRLRLLLAVIRGTDRLAELAEELGLASTGQLYHHVKSLTAAGWLRSAARGHVSVPAERVVPLLVILGASR